MTQPSDVPPPVIPESTNVTSPGPGEPRRSGHGWLVLAVVVAVATLLVVGPVYMVMTGWQPARTTPAPGVAAPPNPGVASPPPPTVDRPNVTWPTPAPADFVLTVKILKQACFGSAGCNVTYHVEVQYAKPLERGKTWDVTYEVKGGDDPQINTLQLTGTSEGYEARVLREESISTPNSSAKLIAEVTAVSAH